LYRYQGGYTSASWLTGIISESLNIGIARANTQKYCVYKSKMSKGVPGIIVQYPNERVALAPGIYQSV